MIPGVRLVVRLTPKSSTDRIDGWAEDAAGRPVLKVRTRAAPVDGRANTALEIMIARALGLAPSAVRLHAGAASKIKTLSIEGLDDAAVRRRLDAAITPP